MWTHYTTLVVWILCLQSERIYSLSPLWDSVKTNVYQEYDVREGNQVWVVRMNMGEYHSTDLVVGEDIRTDSRLTLTCTADHGPAEWVYSGDGKPEFSTNMTIENMSSDGKVLPMDDMNGAKKYVATLTLGKRRLSTNDTGRYNCMTASPETGLKYKTLSAYYHLYVPGNKLFIREGSEVVSYDLSRSAARIPCGVTNPKTSVTLQKLEKGNLLFVPNESMFYHPISGYYPKKDISGTYICTAAFNNTYELIHFTLVPAAPSTESSFHQNIKVTRKKPTIGTNRPEDLQWLMHSIPSKYETENNNPQRVSTTFKPKKPATKSPYIPFHIRYGTTTYAPFQTFHDIKSSPITKPSQFYKHKHTFTSKYKPFNASEYPVDDIITEKVTKRPASQRPTRPGTSSTIAQKVSNLDKNIYRPIHQPIPQDLISYRPVFNFFKDTSRPTSLHSQKPTNPISTHGSSYTTPPTTAPTTSPQQSRTTPRKYRPNFIPTTEMPAIIPDFVICSQSTCGTNAECFVHSVYYESLDETKREAGCRCTPRTYIGNPYLECYPPTPEMDMDTLYFNSSFRSQLKDSTDLQDPENSAERQGSTSYPYPLEIIEM